MTTINLSLSERLDKNKKELDTLLELTDEDFIYLIHINYLSGTLYEIGYLLILNTDEYSLPVKKKIYSRRDRVIQYLAEKNNNRFPL